MRNMQSMRDASLRGSTPLGLLLQCPVRPAHLAEAGLAHTTTILALRDTPHESTISIAQPILPELYLV